MAITKEFIEHLKALGISADKLKDALASEEEVQVDFTSGILLDDTALAELKDQQKKAGYNDGKVAGVEMAIKDAKTKFGLDFEGKTIDNFADAFSTKVLADANIEPDKKVKDAQTKLENLQNTYQADIGGKDLEIGALKSKLNKFQINSELNQFIPGNLKGVKPKQFLTLVGTEYSFEYDEDQNLIAKRGGKPVLDKLEKAVPISDIFSGYAKENNWTEVKGRGGDHEEGSGGSGEFKSEHDVMKYMDENKIDPMSPEGQKIFDEFRNKSN